MPLSNGKPEDPPSASGWGDDDDNMSYTSGSSYSYTASSGSDNEEPKKTVDVKPQVKNGADANVVAAGSENKPETHDEEHSEHRPQQTEWVDDVREDYNMMDLARHPAAAAEPENQKDEDADKRSWLDSDSDDSYGANDFSDSDNESAAPEPPQEQPPSPVREKTPSPPPPVDRTYRMHELMNIEPTEQERTEPEIQPTQIAVVAAVPQDRRESVALDTITEETQSKHTIQSDDSAAEVISHEEEKPRPKEHVVAKQNIPVPPADEWPVNRPQRENRKGSLSKKPSLLSSAVIVDEQKLLDAHYRSLEEEQAQPVAVPLPSKSRDEHSAPPKRPEPAGDKVGNIEYVWDDEYHGANIVVSEESSKECHRKRAIQATDAVRGKYDFIGGVHVFRFTFNDKPYGSHCSIGVCLEDAELSREGYGPVIGKDDFGWAWDIPSRMLIYDNDNCGFYPRENHEQFIHNTIFMELNLEEGTLHFMMEGAHLGPAFSGLPTDESIYPAVTLVYGMAGVTIDLLQSTDKRFKLTPGGVPPLLPVAQPDASPSAIVDNEEVEDASSGSDTDERNVSDEEPEPTNVPERPHISNEKTDSFAALMNMTPAKEEMTLLRAYDKNTINGFGLNIVPNDPFSCRQWLGPNANKNAYPSIGSSLPLENGVHMWHVQLRKEFNSNVKIPEGGNIESVFNSLGPCLYVGVVNDRYKRQNSPESTGLDENSWAWNPILERLFHADKSKQYPLSKRKRKSPPKLVRRNSRRSSLRANVPDNISSSESSDEEGNRKKAQTNNGINLFRGIRVTLDMMQGILCYSYHDGHTWKNLGVAWNDLKGEKLFPHVWLHNSHFAVTMRYIAGNKELMDAPVDTDEANKVRDASFMQAPSFDPRVLQMYRAPEELSQYYVWNPQDCSAGISFRPLSVRQKANNSRICERNLNVSPTQQDVVRCQSGFRSGVHVWLITFDTDEINDNDQYVIGIGTREAVANPITNTTTLRSAVPSVLGGDFYSWGWDLKYHLLYHGEETRGEYPLLEPDFEWSDYSHFKLTMNLQSGTLHADAYTRTTPQECHRLGVMFRDLPKNVSLFPMFGYVRGHSPVMIEYIATSDVGGMQSGGERRTSAVCTLL